MGDVVIVVVLLACAAALVVVVGRIVLRSFELLSGTADRNDERRRQAKKRR